MSNTNNTSIDEAAKDVITKPPFDYPYLDSDPKAQLVFDVSKADHAFIKGIRPPQGTLRIVGALLWKKLCDSCRSQGMKGEFTFQDQFEEFMSSFVIISASEYEKLKADSLAFNTKKINVKKKAVGAE